MGLLSWTVGLPLAPIRGLVGIGKVIQRQVDAELAAPTAVRRRLEELEQEREAGLVSEAEAERREAEITGALTRTAGRAPRKGEG